MRKLSSSFLLVGMIIAYVCMGIFVITGIVFIIMGTPVMENAWRELFKAAAENAGATQAQEDAFVIGMSAGFIAGGIAMLIVAALCIPSAISSGKARKQEERGSYVAAIVFSVICGSYFSVAGGILGLIAKARQERNDRRNKVVDAQ